MRYALLLYAADEARDAAPAETGEGVYDNWIDYTTALKESGALLGAEQLFDVGTATTVRRRGDERLVTDGPFAETKEHLLGLFMIDVGSLDVAMEWAARMPFIRYGSVEVRPAMTGQEWQKILE